MRQRIKICFLVNSLKRGGAERVIANLADYFAAQDNCVIVATPLRLEDEYSVHPEVTRIISEPPEEWLQHGRVRNFFTRLFYLRDIWKRERPDIIVSFIGKVNMMALLSTRGLGIPVLVSVRSDPHREYKAKMLHLLSKTLFVCAKGIIVQTEDARDYFPIWIRKKCKILNNPLNPDFIRERYAGKRRNVILTVGRLDANKNQKLLIDAFGRIEERFPDLELELYGDGNKKKEWEEYSSQKKYSSKIHFKGRCDHVADAIRDARIFVLTSKVEGMPNALMEAMALGLPVVSTDCPCGGPRALIRPEENGLLYPVDDVEQLTHCLERILQDGVLEERLGQKAYETAKQWYPDIVNRQWKEYIESKIKNEQRI